MKGLPIDIDLSNLDAVDVTQICFGATQVMVKFEQEIELTIESECELTSPTGQVESFDHFRDHAVRICTLIGDQVLDASRDSSGGLLLRFRSGTTLHIINDSVAYESFQLRIGSELFVA
jgi:hypothetical protein